jgi:hypothetical protein
LPATSGSEFSSTPSATPTLAEVNVKTAKTQAEMWSAVVASASGQPNPLTALAVSGMNDVLNAQGYAQAASQNRIPITAWVLMGAIAVCGSLLVGMGSRSETTRSKLLMVLPLVVSMAFFLIADIDSPRGGLIRFRRRTSIAWSSRSGCLEPARGAGWNSFVPDAHDVKSALRCVCVFVRKDSEAAPYGSRLTMEVKSIFERVCAVAVMAFLAVFAGGCAHWPATPRLEQAGAPATASAR